jgi:outer membrane protein assembly factor BamB
MITNSSCRKANSVVGDSDFPLELIKTYKTDYSIEKLAVSDSWIAISGANQITAIDLQSDKVLWVVNDIFIDKDSRFEIVNGILFVATSDNVIMINKTGEKQLIKLKGGRENLIQLNAINGEYLYVTRGNEWILEVYSIKKNAFLWETKVGRGYSEVHSDLETDKTYIATSESIHAFESSSGNPLWDKTISITSSFFEDGILYILQQPKSNSVYMIKALNAALDGEEIWNSQIRINSSIDLIQMKVLQSLLVINTGFEYLAYNKGTGIPVWESSLDTTIYNAPLELDGVLYSKGGDGVMYAISPTTGSIIGVMKFAPPSFQTQYDAGQNLYKVNDWIVVSTDTQVFILGVKKTN